MIRIGHSGNWYLVLYRNPCGVVRATFGATLVAAVQRFRFHRNEAWRGERES